VALKLLSPVIICILIVCFPGATPGNMKVNEPLPKCHLTWLGAAVAAPSRVGRTSTLPESSSVPPLARNWTMRQFGLPPPW